MNGLRQLIDGGGRAVGSWCVTPSTLTAELLTADGVDYVCFDCQHGLVDSSTLAALLAASRREVVPIVRVPGNDGAAIGKALDLGAGGVIIPMVGSAGEAAAAVAACRYAPRGTRSYGPARAALTLGQDPADLEGHALCFVMIETPAAVERADEICGVPGLDGVYVGPADLAVGLGIRPADIEGSREHAAAVARVREACARAGIFAGIHTSGGADARRRLAEGFQLVSLPTDAVLLRGALQRELAAARGT
ncbi:MAG TPA: aldolase/citrate lyase family protein [Acidimicrobiales bacterium]|nr:aldolase/citrate lyase family protein [Acidimicrobiales bacterium]